MTLREPRTVKELLNRASALYGKTIGEVAISLNLSVPIDQTKNKGFVGEMIELCLGASAKNLPLPDFKKLGIELKTIPIGENQSPTESTHVCSAVLKPSTRELWTNSRVFKKLKKVLWVPIQSDKTIKLENRIIGGGFLWSPSPEQEIVLRHDWEEHMELIALGKFSELNGERGEYLQIRPKARNSNATASATSESGEQGWALPRGFYLRASFTSQIIQSSMN